MGGMAFLPEELGGAEKQARAHLPPHDIRPLIHQNGKVAVALHPLGEHRVDDRLGGGAKHQWLLELFATRVRDHGRFRRKAFHVLRFLLQERFRNEQRKIRILMARRLELVVERALHALPDPIAVGANDHAALHGRIVRQLAAQHHLVVPRAEVRGARREFLAVSHSMRRRSRE